jgi:hypothetical protein
MKQIHLPTQPNIITRKCYGLDFIKSDRNLIAWQINL